MNIITIKATVVAPPISYPTRFVIEATAECLKWGIYQGKVADGRENGVIDWGDGTTETVSEIYQKTHVYAAPGRYTIGLSDDFESVGVSTGIKSYAYNKTYAPMVREFHTSAQNLTTLLGSCLNNGLNLAVLNLVAPNLRTFGSDVFKGCAALSGELQLRSVTTLQGSTQPFAECTGGITVLHFSQSAEPSITSSMCYQRDNTLGTGTAVCMFDP